MAAKLDNADYRVYCVLSDGECDEGSNWEAALFAAHHRLGSLTAIVDYNKIQSLDTVANTLALEPFAQKWESFGWSVREIDGHNFSGIENVLSLVPFEKGKPSVVVANTIKGKGVNFLEDKLESHYTHLTKEDYENSLKEL